MQRTLYWSKMKNIEISNPDKVLYPRDKITKIDVIKYYIDIADRIMPHIKNRILLTLVGKVMSLLFKMCSRLVITFLPRSKRLLISWLQSPSAVILEPPRIKSDTGFHCFPIYFPWSDGTRCHDLCFLNVEL